jgi:sugar lactone lactonase YvrE
MWIANDASSTTQVAVKKQDISGAHFMVNPTSFAFGARGCTSTRADVPTTSFTSESVCMATIHEEDKTTPFTNNAPGYFMGPTLWTGDKDRFDGGHGGHYDMLHNSPNGMGIAWEEGNVYWVFDGYHSALVRYDFVQDHGPGGTYHADAVVKRYVEGEVARVPNIPSHMAYDKDTGLLYVADTGNNRIAVLDAATGKPGAATFPNMDNSTQYQVDDAILTTLVDGAEVDMVHPSGLELHDGMLFVTDNKTSKIMAFTLEGELLDHLDTGLPTGSLMGLTFDKNGSLFFVDAVRNAVHRVAPK